MWLAARCHGAPQRSKKQLDRQKRQRTNGVDCRPDHHEISNDFFQHRAWEVLGRDCEQAYTNNCFSSSTHNCDHVSRESRRLSSSTWVRNSRFVIIASRLSTFAWSSFKT